jgi:hypothetical protein
VLLTAIATAVVFALFGFPFRYYQCWFSFGWLSTLGGMVLYFALAGGGGGLLGWAVATLSNARPTQNDTLNGILYGIGGALAFRADFQTRTKGAAIPDVLKDAKSALTASVNWTANFLDEITYTHAERWLSGMNDGELVTEARFIQADIVERPRTVVSDKAKNELFKRLVPAMELLGSSDRRVEGRAHLITFCAGYYKTEHLPKKKNSYGGADGRQIAHGGAAGR